jgi:serine/threonine protein kinase
MATGQVRDWVADYQVLRPLSSPDRNPRTFVAVSPRRLGGEPRQVVVHLIDAEPDRFEAAVVHLRAVAAARSARIAALVEVGRDDREGEDPVAYYVTEYRPAGSLSNPSSVSANNPLMALAQAARGVHDLHQAGKVHGDLGPGSVLLADDGAVVTVPHPPAPMEVGETAMARPPDRLETLDPAIIRGEGRSRATDVWALGATMHLALTGQSLHPGLSDDDPLTAVQRVLFEPPVVDPRLPPRQAAVVMSCIRANPEDRLASAEDLAVSLEALAGAP